MLSEGKFHGTKDAVCLFTAAGSQILAVFSLAEFEFSGELDFASLSEFIKVMPAEEIKLTRYAELSAGKKEKLRCGCRGYICLVGDERRLEVYEITDS